MADHTKRQRTIEDAFRCEGGADVQGREFLLLDRKQVINTIWNMQESLMVLSPDANVWFVNKAAEDMLGFNICEMLGMPVGKFVADDNLEFFNAIRNVVKGGEIRGMRLDYIAKDGKKIPVSVNAGDLRQNSTNMLLGMIVVARDMRDVLGLIEGLKEAKENLEEKVKERTKELEDALEELKQTQAHLLQREKMASIGQLAAGIAHEINNPIGFISSNFNTLTGYVAEMRELLNMYNWLDNAIRGEDFDEAYKLWKDIDRFKNDIDVEFISEDIGKLIAESKGGIERVRTIVADLKNFSHKSEDEMKKFDVNKGIESTIHLVWNEIKYKADVKKEYGTVPMIMCYPQQINQVFTNLLVNAAQAMPEKGEIKIKTYTESFMHTNNGWVVAEIEDTGCGMTDDVKQKIFEPFFTTKP